MTNTMNPAAQPEPADAQNPAQEPVQFTVEVGPMAHGGHCVAQHDDRAVFVRHAIPGEIVVAQLTETGPSERFLLADTVEVIRASEFRRSHQWKIADSLRAHSFGREPVSGAEYGHIVLEYQRRLKANVFRDTMVRVGKQNVDDMEISVEGVEADGAHGLDWRTRNTFVVSPVGRLCMPVHRGLNPVVVRNVPLAVPQLDALGLWGLDFSGAARIEVTTPAHGRDALINIIPRSNVANSKETLATHVENWREAVSGLPQHVSVVVSAPAGKGGRKIKVTQVRGQSWVAEDVASELFGTRSFRVSGHGRWPAHRDGPVTLVDAVMQAADAQPGQTVADLYAGSGLFSRYLAEAVGADGAVLAVEDGVATSQDASINLREVPQATVLHGNINRVMNSWHRKPEADFTAGGLNDRQVDTVVMSPHRKGAGKAVLGRIDQLTPEKIIYVSSDPASLARDTRRLNYHGWVLDSVEVYDLAPDTQHMESVCVFTKP